MAVRSNKKKSKVVKIVIISVAVVVLGTVGVFVARNAVSGGKTETATYKIEEMIPGAASGNVILKKTLRLLTPKDFAACSSVGLMFSRVWAQII